MNDIGVFLSVVCRAILLWLAIPLGVIFWALAIPVTSATVGACLGWIDLNLIVLLQRTIFRPMIRDLPAWIPLSQMRVTAHRIKIIDLW